jgi:hypothetical protein
MKLELNSGLFSVLDPCGYWVFDGLREMLEEDENLRHEEERAATDGHYEVDYARFLDIIARRWVEGFSDRLKEAGIKAKAQYTGHYSPKEYNFRHDEADFTLAVTKTEVQRLAALCRADGRFRQHMKDAYSSRDGFWSFLTDDTDIFAENAAGKHGQKEYERAVWQAVNFIMFPDEETSEAWNQAFTERVYDADFSETLCFVEDKEGLAV